MHCPNCRHILTKVDLGGIEVEHCNNCGGTLFESNEINRVTRKDAERLSLMKQTDIISGAEKISPRDGSTFKRINSPSIPSHVTLLQSESTGEVFTFADDLLEFKNAQDAKVSYYKSWRIPMPPVKNVLVFSFAVFATTSLAYLVTLVQSPATQSIQAQTFCEGGISTIPLENSYVISCTTPVDLGCEVQARCNTGDIIELTCAQNTYFGTVSPDTCPQVQFYYEDNDGRVETEWENLD